MRALRARARCAREHRRTSNTVAIRKAHFLASLRSKPPSSDPPSPCSPSTPPPQLPPSPPIPPPRHETTPHRPRHRSRPPTTTTTTTPLPLPAERLLPLAGRPLPLRTTTTTPGCTPVCVPGILCSSSVCIAPCLGHLTTRPMGRCVEPQSERIPALTQRCSGGGVNPRWLTPPQHRNPI